MAQHSHSEACCTIPPAKADYTVKGSYIELDGMKTYKTGPSVASTAIIIIYDIFGLSPQALQGADLLAHSKKYQVFIPDWFRGNPVSHSDFPPNTPEKKTKMDAFFQGKGAPSKTASEIPSTIAKICEQTGNVIKKWGIVGACWGGKVVSITSRKGTLFSAAAEVHPAMIDPKDGKEITIPICILASKDEDTEAVKGFEAALKHDNHVETFSDQPHGWMGARANLSDERSRSEYERGYRILADFFHKHL